jgi:thioredoxin-like negative regulator of GroEL
VINPDFVDARYNLGHLLVEMGRNEEAIEHFRIIARVQPGYGDTDQMLRDLGVARGGEKRR